jgi:CHASE2 domain-containing sensor protein
MEFLLEVWQVDQTCLFKLSWGKGHSLNARMPFPQALPQYYQDWSQAYHRYYTQPAQSPSRGRTGLATTIPVSPAHRPANPETWLNFTQNQLINALRDWLRGRELFEIRQALTAAQGSASINLLVQCQDDPNSLETAADFSLAKLPWECWGQELSDRAPIQVLRTTSQRPVIVKRSRRSRLRILAIFGDDTGLDFQAERAAIEAKLKPIAYIQFEGYNISPKAADTNLKTQIRQAIEDPRGWDILFFAGHSDDELGGEVLLAPGYSALISEFEDVLKTARDRGLQFALFNSCRGCAIADRLIAYGLSHVVVMRERVTNQVAQVFFLEFADRLANLQDVQTAALGAAKALAIRSQERYQHPSAYLVPSVYAYLGVQPLKPPPFNWRVLGSLLTPTRREVIVLAALAIVSSQTAIQYPLIDARQATQAVYRQVAEVLGDKVNGKASAAPPILLVNLDDDSLQAANASKDPIDRGYLAKLMQKTNDLKIRVVGVDYVLKDPMPDRAAIAKAVATNPGRFVFGASATWGVADSETVPPDIRIDGDIGVNDRSSLPLQYPVFLARTIGDPTTIKSSPAQPHAFAQQLLCRDQQKAQNCRSADPKAYYSPITELSRWVGAQWLNPWIDYSIPPGQVYRSVSAQQFLQQSAQSQKIVLLVPSPEFDPFKTPMPLKNGQPEGMSGGQIHAYTLYNLMNRGLIVPIPDLWIVGIVGIGSKLLAFWLQQRPREQAITRRGWWVMLGLVPLVAYLISLQTYIGLGIAIPVLFPLLAYFSYLLPQWLRHRKLQRQRSSLA